MNNDWNTETAMLRQLRDTKLPEVDLKVPVMNRIYAHVMVKNKALKVKKTPVWVAVCCLLFLATASVSAAAYVNINWHGIKIAVQPAPEFRGTTTIISENLDQMLMDAPTRWRTVAASEAALRLGFSPLTPAGDKYQPVRTIGVLPVNKDQRAVSEDEPWLEGVYDWFEIEGQTVVVRQIQDRDMSRTVRDELTMSLTFMGGEQLNLLGDSLAVYNSGERENTLQVYYKTTDILVIKLELSGNIPKDKLITLAECYLR